MGKIDLNYVKIVTDPKTITTWDAAAIFGIPYNSLWYLTKGEGILDYTESNLFKQKIRIVVNDKFFERLRITGRMAAYDQYVEGVELDKIKGLPKNRINAAPKKQKSGRGPGRPPKYFIEVEPTPED